MCRRLPPLLASLPYDCNRLAECGLLDCFEKVGVSVKSKGRVSSTNDIRTNVFGTGGTDACGLPNGSTLTTSMRDLAFLSSPAALSFFLSLSACLVKKIFHMSCPSESSSAMQSESGVPISSTISSVIPGMLLR